MDSEENLSAEELELEALLQEFAENGYMNALDGPEENFNKFLEIAERALVLSKKGFKTEVFGVGTIFWHLKIRRVCRPAKTEILPDEEYEKRLDKVHDLFEHKRTS